MIIKFGFLSVQNIKLYLFCFEVEKQGPKYALTNQKR